MPIDPTWFLGKRTGGDPPPLPELSSGVPSLTTLKMRELEKDRSKMLQTIKHCMDSYYDDYTRMDEVARILLQRTSLQKRLREDVAIKKKLEVM
ncbi:unnamed protein product [Vitrella brassicaformis CCMP3155]|uniref:Uncharacterized protein n=1 Tax=Vitrella brassicaformis (strain CCMP3155) TaxID=1169540 RepID=A0A0G4GHR1_VITBC|nr:unnamed protein product [Vitrella brassicaformis CCMP3155]|eukprot:CEM29269.1 unnamed protein product [Vitrella brassicaformis CCMP3155]